MPKAIVVNTIHSIPFVSQNDFNTSSLTFRRVQAENMLHKTSFGTPIGSINFSYPAFQKKIDVAAIIIASAKDYGPLHRGTIKSHFSSSGANISSNEAALALSRYLMFGNCAYFIPRVIQTHLRVVFVTVAVSVIFLT